MKKIYEAPTLALANCTRDFLEISTGSDIWKSDHFDDGYGKEFGSQNA